MNEDFVPFELAVKLKEKGYPQDGLRRYDKNGNKYLGDNTNAGCCAPTIAQVLKWLREEKEIHIVIDIWGRTWGYDILTLPSGSSLHWTAYNDKINSYEQAALAGIEYVLDNLI